MMKNVLRIVLVGAAACATTAVAPSRANAFCGFYVSGGGAKMFNDATQVVLMRAGTRTVLSMQNDYNGPIEDFALVVPVPVVLKASDVKTLPKSVFDHVDSLGAPRLVEYWEQDPCEQLRPRGGSRGALTKSSARPADDQDASIDRKTTVKIEAKFVVGEYQVLILSATEATGLETWLRTNKYKIPADAAALLQPYIVSGSKFFVAKVNPKKVSFVGNRAELSPLRFSYDSEDFSLPIRLGMANSSGTQDLIINIIAADKRFEVANYKNVTIPTNFDVRDSVKPRFGEFYAALFDRTTQQNPGAVVTEYSWQATPSSKCDPCPPEETLVSPSDLALLGGDVLAGPIATGTFVLTRLHARYGKADMKDDLRFREAGAIVGGREQRNANNQLEYGSSTASQNNFQARYAMRHWWTGAITCQNPRRGIWGGPWNYNEQDNDMIIARKVAFAPRGNVRLASLVKRDLPEIGIRRWRPAPAAPAVTPSTPTAPAGGFATPPPSGGKPTGATVPRKAMSFGLGGGLALALLAGSQRLVRRRKRNQKM